MTQKIADVTPARNVRPPLRRVRSAAPPPVLEDSVRAWKQVGALGSGRLSCVALYRAEPLERIELVKAGVMARDVPVLGRRMDLSNERLYAVLGLSRSTVDRKVREDKPLSRDEGERVLGLARLIGQVDAMVAESGNAAGFDAAPWLARWLDEPLPALGGRPPSDYMDTAEGQTLVADMLLRLQSGAYA